MPARVLRPAWLPLTGGHSHGATALAGTEVTNLAGVPVFGEKRTRHLTPLLLLFFFGGGPGDGHACGLSQKFKPNGWLVSDFPLPERGHQKRTDPSWVLARPLCKKKHSLLRVQGTIRPASTKKLVQRSNQMAIKPFGLSHFGSQVNMCGSQSCEVLPLKSSSSGTVEQIWLHRRQPNFGARQAKPRAAALARPHQRSWIRRMRRSKVIPGLKPTQGWQSQCFQNFSHFKRQGSLTRLHMTMMFSTSMVTLRALPLHGLRSWLFASENQVL